MTEPYAATVGIVGAGSKGRAIAVYALLGGYRVILEDVSSARLADASAYISSALDSAVAHGQLGVIGRNAVAANFATVHSIDDVSRAADVLIEAAPEDVELQLEIFTIFDKFAKPHAILATTAQAISVADLAEMTNCPERCVGFRFTDSASNRVLRIVRAPKTSDCTIQTCENFARKLVLAPSIESEPANEPAAIQKAHTS